MTKWKIYNEDAVEWAKNYKKGKFHALLCDAPYHLTSIVKRFGKKNSAPAKEGTDGVFRRASAGFMGQQWDGGDLAFRPETWEAFGEVLYPGAFGMAFSASRNWHRMAVAIEDAGFILHPSVFLWSFGSGFPKATRVHKQGDGDFDGHRYGLQALKPAVEPIIVFQKRFEGKPRDNIVETGAGTINIDGGRIPTPDEYVINQFDDGMKPFGDGAGHKYKSIRIPQSNPQNRSGVVGTDLGISNSDIEKFQESQRVSTENMANKGRWPANLILDGSAERLDAQTGTLQSGKPSGKKKADNNIYGKYKNEDVDVTGFGDMGGPSRFFYNVSTKLDESDPVYYCSKSSPRERNAGLDDMEPKERKTQGRATVREIDRRDGKGKVSVDAQIRPRQNTHPTLKPIDLCRYLATLLLPPAEYAPRRIFIPFSGVASEMIGAGLAGWEHVVGVEFDTENGYVDIAEKRLEHWLK